MYFILFMNLFIYFNLFKFSFINFKILCKILIIQFMHDPFCNTWHRFLTMHKFLCLYYEPNLKQVGKSHELQINWRNFLQELNLFDKNLILRFLTRGDDRFLRQSEIDLLFSNLTFLWTWPFFLLTLNVDWK
jgi:hypothetical protein